MLSAGYLWIRGCSVQQGQTRSGSAWAWRQNAKKQIKRANSHPSCHQIFLKSARSCRKPQRIGKSSALRARAVSAGCLKIDSPVIWIFPFAAVNALPVFCHHIPLRNYSDCTDQLAPLKAISSPAPEPAAHGQQLCVWGSRGGTHSHSTCSGQALTSFKLFHFGFPCCNNLMMASTGTLGHTLSGWECFILLGFPCCLLGWPKRFCDVVCYQKFIFVQCQSLWRSGTVLKHPFARR